MKALSKEYRVFAEMLGKKLSKFDWNYGAGCEAEEIAKYRLAQRLGLDVDGAEFSSLWGAISEASMEYMDGDQDDSALIADWTPEEQDLTGLPDRTWIVEIIGWNPVLDREGTIRRFVVHARTEGEAGRLVDVKSIPEANGYAVLRCQEIFRQPTPEARP